MKSMIRKTSLFLLVSLPYICKDGKEVKDTGHIHIGIPVRQKLMIEIVNKTLICVSLQIYSESLD